MGRPRRDFVDDRQRESRRLAGARLSRGDQIVPVGDDGNGFLLDGRRLGVAAIGQSPQNGLTQPEFGKIGNSHGFTPQVFVLSVQELHNAIVSNPFPEGDSDPISLHLSFLESSPANPDLKKLEFLKSETERFKLIDTVFYLHAPNGIGRSKLAANVEKSLGVALTARNWRSARTILSMAMEVDA
jgi:hypothetical protein